MAMRPKNSTSFATRYEQELSGGEAAEAFSELKRLARGGDITLVTASRDVEISQAAVLATLLGQG